MPEAPTANNHRQLRAMSYMRLTVKSALVTAGDRRVTMESAESSRPSWQTDGCPMWCVSDHREEDFPEDRFHDSAPTVVPVIVPGDDTARIPETTALHIVTSRRCGGTEDWIFIGQPDRACRGLTLSRESAHRLRTALSNHLADS